MQAVSEQFKIAITQPSREIKSRITFPDLILDDTTIQRIEWDSTLIGVDDFEIGTAPMDMVNVSLLYEVDEPVLYDFDEQECEIEVGISLPDDTIEYVSIGKYTVDRAEKTNNVMSLHAVDRMYKFETPYESDLAYPATLLQIAQDICDLTGVELATGTFPNSDYEVAIKPEFTDMSCRSAIAQIAELAGGYARIDRTGKLEIFNIQTTALSSRKYASNQYILGDTFIADELIIGDIEITSENYIDFSNKRLPTAKIEKVIVSTGSEEAVRGSGENIYHIVNNIFCQNPHTAIDAIYNVLKGLSYTPFNMKWQGNPAVDCGDMITVRSKQGGYYNTLVTRRKLTYTGGLREDYEAVGKSNIEKDTTPRNVILDVENLKTEFRILNGEVSAKVSKDSIINEINLSTEGIRIRADKIDLIGAVTVLSDITGNLGSITAGTITGATVRTSSGDDRIELSSNLLSSYYSGVRRVQLDYDSLDFYTAEGVLAGDLIAIPSTDYDTAELAMRGKETASLSGGSSSTFGRVIAGDDGWDTFAILQVQDGSINNRTSITVTPNVVQWGHVGCSTYASGDFTVINGTKAATVQTDTYGLRKLYALETPDNRFVTYIEKELPIGEHYIEIEPMFRQTISSYFVVPHVQNMSSVSIVEIEENGFGVLVEDKPAKAVFEVNGKRKGYEDIYMEEVVQDENKLGRKTTKKSTPVS
jgi:hypothetical protein